MSVSVLDSSDFPIFPVSVVDNDSRLIEAIEQYDVPPDPHQSLSLRWGSPADLAIQSRPVVRNILLPKSIISHTTSRQNGSLTLHLRTKPIAFPISTSYRLITLITTEAQYVIRTSFWKSPSSIHSGGTGAKLQVSHHMGDNEEEVTSHLLLDMRSEILIDL